MIRPMREADAEAIGRIQAATPGASQWDARGYLAFEAYVIEIEGDVAGFLALRETAADEAEILILAVAPEWRRQGLARMLLERAAFSRPRVLFLEVRESNEPARALYQALGFTEYGRRPGYYANPPDVAVLMRRFPKTPAGVSEAAS